MDVLVKGSLESMLESSPTMIGFNPKWPLNRVATQVSLFSEKV